MSTEANKTNARRIPLEVSNQNRIDLAPEVATEDVINRSPLPRLPATGLPALTALVELVRSAFPDIEYTLEHEIAEGDYVVHHLSRTGTQRGEFFGVSPTGRRVTWTEMHIVKMREGKMAEHWGQVDALGILQQLGAAPGPAGA